MSPAGPRIPRDDNVDFGGAELPVKCGNVEGILYKEKLKQGEFQISSVLQRHSIGHLC